MYLIIILEKVIRYAEALKGTYVDVSVRLRRGKHLHQHRIIQRNRD